MDDPVLHVEVCGHSNSDMCRRKCVLNSEFWGGIWGSKRCLFDLVILLLTVAAEVG